MTNLDPGDATSSDVARRTVLGAAWSTPVIAAAVGAPGAAASPGEITAELVWVDPPGVQNESSLLQLRLQPSSSGEPVVRGTGMLTLTVLDSHASSPARSVAPPPGWTVIDSGRTITVIAPAGVTAGAKGFTVEWGELSSNWTVAATWTESEASGSVSATIEVGPRGFPAMDWTVNPAVYGGASTLRLTVPADCYAIGYQALITTSAELPEDSVITLPEGWSLSDQTVQGSRILVGPETAAGVFDFGFTFGAGSAPVTVVPQWISPTAPGPTPIAPHVPLQLAPA